MRLGCESRLGKGHELELVIPVSIRVGPVARASVLIVLADQENREPFSLTSATAFSTISPKGNEIEVALLDKSSAVNLKRLPTPFRVPLWFG